jgi:hypothetical protein
MEYYITATKYYDFILPPFYYIKIISNSYHVDMMKHATHGRTKDDMPFFSIAGITFAMIAEEEADKYRILK